MSNSTDDATMNNKGCRPSRMLAQSVAAEISKNLRVKADAMQILAEMTAKCMEKGIITEDDESKLWHLYSQMW